MSEKGKIIVRKSKKGKLIFEVDLGGKKPMLIPPFYELKDESLNGKECDVEREQGQIRKIMVDGKELPRKQEVMKIQNKKVSPTPSDKNRQDKFNMENTKLPKDTRECLASGVIDNYTLKLNKAAQYIDDKFIFFKVDRKGNIQLNIQPDYTKVDFSQLAKRQQDVCNYLELSGYNVKHLKNVKISWRLVIGLGGESVYETSMTLHHIYGIPYIPGSAIKGITRHWAESKNDPDFVEVFGDESQEGNVIFMDAFPKDNIELEVDIMNPHYPDYYTKQKPPTDYQNPNPIFFLTVGKNTKFTFYLLSKNRKLLDKTISWLKSALLEHGIGAKTAVGYGIFNVGEV